MTDHNSLSEELNTLDDIDSLFDEISETPKYNDLLFDTQFLTCEILQLSLKNFFKKEKLTYRYSNFAKWDNSISTYQCITLKMKNSIDSCSLSFYFSLEFIDFFKNLYKENNIVNTFDNFLEIFVKKCFIPNYQELSLKINMKQKKEDCIVTFVNSYESTQRPYYFVDLHIFTFDIEGYAKKKILIDFHDLTISNKEN